MGLDLLDVSFRIKKQLGVDVSDDDWTSLVRAIASPRTLGLLIACLPHGLHGVARRQHG
jgi:hypothetical protein